MINERVSLRSLLVDYLQKGATVGGIKMLSMPLALWISVLLVRWLGPAGYGLYAIAWSIATVGAAAISGGVSQHLTRCIATLAAAGSHQQIRPYIGASMLFVLLSGMIFMLGLIVCWMMGATPLAMSGHTILLISMCAAAIGIMNTSNAGLRAMERVSEGQLCLLILSPLASVMLLVTLKQFTAPLTSSSALAAMALGYAVGASISYVRLVKLTKYFGRSSPSYTLMLTVAAKSRGYIAYSTVMVAGLQVNLILVGLLMSEEDVAYYNLAEKAAQFVSLPVGILELIMASRVASLFSEGNYTSLQQLFRTLRRVGLAFALVIAAALYLCGEYIISGLMGQENADKIVPVLMTLLVAQLLRAAVGPLTVTLLMTGYQKYCVASQLLGALTLSAATWLVVPTYGLQGAGLAASVGILAMSLPLVIGANRKLGLRTEVF